MNINVKVLSNSNSRTCKLYTMTKWYLFHTCKFFKINQFNPSHQLTKGKMIIIMFIDTGKAFEKTQYQFKITNSNKEQYLILTNNIWKKKSTANRWQETRYFQAKIQKEARCWLLPILFKIVLKVLLNTQNKTKQNKINSIKIGKEEINLLLQMTWFAYVENSTVNKTS